MTPLNKRVRRLSETTVRDAGRVKRLAVTLYPNGTLGLRPEGTRREELITLDAVYDRAVKQRVSAEQRERKARRKK